MKPPSDSRAPSPWILPAWAHSTIAAFLTLTVATLDATLPAFSIFYILPAIYVLLLIRGRAELILNACVGMAVMMVPLLGDPSRITTQGMFNRAVGVSLSACVAYVIYVRRRFTNDLQHANEHLEERVASRSAELEDTILRLRESEQQFVQFMQHLPGLAWIKNTRGHYVYANDSALKAFRKSREELYGKTDDEIFPPATAAQFKEADRHAISSGLGVQVVETLEQEDGVLHHSIVSKFPLPGPDGKPQLVGGIAIDITERQAAEETIRKLNAFRETIIRTAAEGICVCHATPEYPHVCFSVWNERMTEITGYTLEEINRLGWYQTLYQDTEIREQAILRMSNMRHGDNLRAEEWEITRKDGIRRTIAISTSQLEIERGIQAIAAFIQDVTERLQAETQLRQSEERFRALVEYGYDGINILDANAQSIYSSPGNPVLVGLAPGEVDDDALGFVHPEDRPAIQQSFAQLVANPNKVFDLEMRLVRKDGSHFWAEAHARNLFEHPAVRGIVVNWRDVTERKSVEDQLKKSEQRYQLIAELATSFYYIARVSEDGQADFQWVSGKVEELTGYRAKEFSELNWRSLVDETDHSMITERITQLISTQSLPAAPQELRIRHRNGDLRWVRSTMRAVPAQASALPLVYGAVLDITDRKKTEESLEMMRFCVDHAGESVFWVGRQGRILYVNQAASASRGYSNEELLAMTIFDLDPDYQSQIWDVHFESLKNQGTLTFQTRHRAKDGRIFPIEVNANYVHIGDQEFNFAFARDITERKQAENALRENEERFRLLFDGANDAIFWANAETGLITHCNQAAVALLGWERKEIIGKSQAFLHPQEEADHYRELFKQHATSQSKSTMEVQALRKDGSRVDVSVSPSVTNIGGQKILQGIFRDVTERKKLEQSLLLTQFSIDHAADPIFWVAPNAEILYVNEAASRTLGYSREEMIGKTVPEIDTNFPASAWPAHWEELKERKSFTFHSDHQTKEGKVIYTEVTVNFLEYGGRELNCAMMRDITERRKLEAQILHTQKLESLGVLAGGLAHDFNNLLAIMLGYSHMALTQLPQNSTAGPMLREIELAAQRASDLTRQMLAYTGKGKTTIEPIRLDSLTQELADLLKSIISKKATLDLDIHPATILGDATQIRQVVMNLITNASDALEEKQGAIRVRTGVRTLDAAQLESPFTPERLSAGNYAFVDVEDNGCGMDEQTCSKIFDPFFSTKFTGRGLGLAAVLGIVRGHHGVIKVRSALGRGTLFEVLIPVSTETVTPSTTSNDALALQSLNSRGLILIVEDDPKIRELTSAILENAGFSVCTAEDGQRGIEVFQQHQGAVTAILVDMTMPRVDGQEFLVRLRALDPQIPVVVMSGYSPQETSQRCAGMGATLFLQKPFEPGELLQRMSESLMKKNS